MRGWLLPVPLRQSRLQWELGVAWMRRRGRLRRWLPLVSRGQSRLKVQFRWGVGVARMRRGGWPLLSLLQPQLLWELGVARVRRRGVLRGWGWLRQLQRLLGLLDFLFSRTLVLGLAQRQRGGRRRRQLAPLTLRRLVLARLRRRREMRRLFPPLRPCRGLLRRQLAPPTPRRLVWGLWRRQFALPTLRRLVRGGKFPPLGPEGEGVVGVVGALARMWPV